MGRQSLLVMLALAALPLFGCIAVEKPAPSHALSEQKVFEKNYTIGQEMMAVVGADMIRVKDYTMSQMALNEVEVPQDFTIDGPIFSHSFHKGESFPLAGSTEYDGKTYRLMKVGFYGVMFGDDGTVLGKIVSDIEAHGKFTRPVVMLYSFDVKPAGAKLVQKIENKAQNPQAGKNFVLSFAGLTSDSMRLSYREYTADESGGSSVQDLTYPRDAKEIRFCNFKLAIIEAASDRLRYKVIGDQES